MADCPRCGAFKSKLKLKPDGIYTAVCGACEEQKEMTTQTPKYLGLDLETTGLDPTKDRILEVGIVILANDWTELGAWTTAVYCPESIFDARVDEYVRKMHTDNGLVTEIPTGLPLTYVEDALIKVAATFPKKPLPVGSSIQFDVGFVSYWMPEFASKLSHRLVDDRTLKEVFGVRPVPNDAPHRALPDIRATVELIRRTRARGLA